MTQTLKHQMPNPKAPRTKESVGSKAQTAAESWEHRPPACRVSSLSNASNQCAQDFVNAVCANAFCSSSRTLTFWICDACPYRPAVRAGISFASCAIVASCCAILRCVLKTLAQQTCKSVVWLISDYCASVVLLIFPKTKTMCSEGLLCNLWTME